MSRLFLCISLMSGVAGLVAQDSTEIHDQDQDLSSLEFLVKNMQKELDMESYIIKVESLPAPGLFACVMLCELGYYIIYVDESWLKTLTSNELRFIIGHELMHIKLGHTFENRSNNPIFRPFRAYFSRQDEKEADLTSALGLKCAQGGIDIFEKVLKEENAFFAKKKIPLVVKSTLYCLLGDHPSFETRIKYLKALMVSPAYTEAQAAA